MDGWSGFSDEDLRRLKHSPSDNSRQSNEKTQPNNPTRSGPVRAAQSRKTNPKAIPAKRLPDDSNQLLSLEQRLSVSAATAAETDDGYQKEKTRSSGEKRTTTTNEAAKRLESTGTGMSNLTQDKNQSDKAQPEGSVQEGGSGEDLILDEQFILKHEIADLEKFREHQKMMEEQNKKKKEMLTVAIQQRQKKAKVEATKLTLIKKELERLDQMVNADVSVIRNKIEEISRDFLEAQKRYDRAEKEFVEAKVDLHKKALQKEQLTEHLYTVIHQNEQRKAKKLSELMNKLEMTDDDDELLLADDSYSSPVPILHMSASETRKGCLQSLGLSLMSSAPATANSAENNKADEAANGDKEDKSSVARSDNAAPHTIPPNSPPDATQTNSGTKGDSTSNDGTATASETTITVDRAVPTVGSVSNNQTDSLLDT